MKKALILALPLLIITSCGYKSAYEARENCKNWVNEKGKYTGVIKAIKKTDKNKDLPKVVFTDTVNTFPVRRCLKEEETNKFIGLAVTNREEKKGYIFPQGNRLKNDPSKILDNTAIWEVEKRFKY